MYHVDTDEQAQDQIDALPTTAVQAYAEPRVTLETAPWRGRSFHRDDPHAPMRAHVFGTHGLAVYVILEDRRRVSVLLVVWAG